MKEMQLNIGFIYILYATVYLKYFTARHNKHQFEGYFLMGKIYRQMIWLLLSVNANLFCCNISTANTNKLQA